MSGADLREVSAQRVLLQDVPLPHPRFQWSVDGLCDRFGTLARRRLGAPLGNGATANAWFAAPPSDTDGVHKDYREYFLGSQDHLRQAQTAARSVVLAELGD
ncbi:hypothetical protein [Streptomyces sp. NPDC058268]|uniref:hypothetical protein n=1 Tax=Streptomyces sp. NPDC058268 TaxID=3346413 RepID=UPI0036E9B5EA